jgi:hypothetical protein
VPSLIGIAEAVEQLREEIDRAQKTRAENGSDGTEFEIVEAEVELLVQIRREGGGNAGVGIGVVTVGADGRYGNTTAHRLRLKLRTSETVMLSGRP